MMEVCPCAISAIKMSKKTQKNPLPSHALYSWQEPEPTANMGLAQKDNAPFLGTLNTDQQVECVPALLTLQLPCCAPAE